MKTLHEIVQESFADQHRKMGHITSRHTAEYLSKNNVVVKRYGQWEGEGDGYADGELVYDVWYCSECEHCIDNGTDDPGILPNYCPSCGAEMRGAYD